MKKANNAQKQKPEYFRIAHEKSESPYKEPDTRKQLLVVSNNYKLLAALTEMADEENAQLRHARPNTPDLIVFSGAVKVIDRQYLGKDSWETYCDYLSQVNEGYVGSDVTGKISNAHNKSDEDEVIYDDTPIILIDKMIGMVDNYEFIPPAHALGEVKYIDRDSVQLIVQATRSFLRKSNSLVATVRALRDGEFKEFKEVDLQTRLI